jgi:Mg-chelatase subunit ChlD
MRGYNYRRMVRIGRVLLVGAAILSLVAPVIAQRQARKLFVTVVDQQGAPVLDLGAVDFKVKEGGAAREVVRARISSQPMRVALVVDSSDESQRAINELRAALTEFLTRLPAEHEVAFLTIGRQMRVRVQPTIDRARLLNEAKRFSADGAGTVFLDGAREINDRFLRKVDDKWPVMVVIATDGPETSGTTHDDDYLRFVQDLALRQTTVHTFLLQAHGGGLTSEIGMNLARNTGGQYEALLTNNLLPDKMTALAEKLENDHRRMSIAYEIDYAADAKDAPAALEIELSRPGFKVQLSVRRPI